jgi:gamma-glutamyltranspeptidase/glutathione hydrolase
MGGFMQPQGHVQVVTGLIDDRATPQSVLDRPRFCIEPLEGDSKIQLEEGLSPATVEGLRARGHPVVPNVSGHARSMFGRGQIIRSHMQTIAAVGSDRRADGCAETI